MAKSVTLPALGGRDPRPRRAMGPRRWDRSPRLPGVPQAPEEIFLRKIRTRLSLQIPAFKLIRKGRIVDRLMADPRILAAVDESARTRNVPAADVLKKVESYAREIVPSFHAFAYYLLGGFIGATFVRSLYRVRVGYVDEDSLAEIPPDSSVVFLLNHRSNLDYILLGYLTLGRAPLSFAVGESARGWPIRPLVTALGASPSAGGRRPALPARPGPLSDDGRGLARPGHFSRRPAQVEIDLWPPEGRLLDYLLRGFDPEGARDLIFIPAGVNLDRVFEDRTLLSGEGGRRRGRAARASRDRVVHPPQFLADGAGRLAAVRLRGHLFRPAGLNAGIRQGGRDRFPRAERGRANRSGRPSGPRPHG